MSSDDPKLTTFLSSPAGREAQESAAKMFDGIVPHPNPRMPEEMQIAVEADDARTGDLKILAGVFSVTNGELSFTCTTQNVSFSEVLDGLTKLRDEIDRQIRERGNCPYNDERADARRQGNSRLHGRPLDENGNIELTVERTDAPASSEASAVEVLWEREIRSTSGAVSMGRYRIVRDRRLWAMLQVQGGASDGWVDVESYDRFTGTALLDLAERLAAADADKRARAERAYKEGATTRGQRLRSTLPLVVEIDSIADDWLASRARAELERAK